MHGITMPLPDGTLYGQDRTIKGHAYTTTRTRALMSLAFANGAATERKGAAAQLRANPNLFASPEAMERAIRAVEERGTDIKQEEA